MPLSDRLGVDLLISGLFWHVASSMLMLLVGRAPCLVPNFTHSFFLITAEGIFVQKVAAAKLKSLQADACRAWREDKFIAGSPFKWDLNGPANKLIIEKG